MVGDVDYSAADVLARVQERLRSGGVRLVLSNVVGPVRDQLDRYGLDDQLGLKALPRFCAYEKLRALSRAASRVRQEIGR